MSSGISPWSGHLWGRGETVKWKLYHLCFRTVILHLRWGERSNFVLCLDSYSLWVTEFITLSSPASVTWLCSTFLGFVLPSSGDQRELLNKEKWNGNKGEYKKWSDYSLNLFDHIASVSIPSSSGSVCELYVSGTICWVNACFMVDIQKIWHHISTEPEYRAGIETWQISCRWPLSWSSLVKRLPGLWEMK